MTSSSTSVAWDKSQCDARNTAELFSAFNVSVRVAVGLGGREYSLTPAEIEEVSVAEGLRGAQDRGVVLQPVKKGTGGNNAHASRASSADGNVIRVDSRKMNFGRSVVHVYALENCHSRECEAEGDSRSQPPIGKDDLQASVGELGDLLANIMTRTRVISICTDKLKKLIYQKMQRELDSWKHGTLKRSLEHKSEEEQVRKEREQKCQVEKTYTLEQTSGQPPADLLNVPSERFLDIAVADADLVYGPGAVSLIEGRSSEHETGFLQSEDSELVSPKLIAHLNEERPHFVVVARPFPKIRFRGTATGDETEAECLPQKLVTDEVTKVTEVEEWKTCEFQSRGGLEEHGSIPKSLKSATSGLVVCANLNQNAADHCHYVVGTWTEAVLAVLEWFEWPLGGEVAGIQQHGTEVLTNERTETASFEKAAADDRRDLHTVLQNFLTRDRRSLGWKDLSVRGWSEWLELEHEVVPAPRFLLHRVRQLSAQARVRLIVGSREIEYILHELFVCMASTSNLSLKGVCVGNDVYKAVADTLDVNGDSLLHVAAAFGCQNIVSNIFQRFHSSACNESEDRKIVNLKNGGSQTPFFLAACCGYHDIVRFMLDSGRVDPNVADRFGWAALYAALDKGYPEVASLLISDAAVDLNVSGPSGCTPLQKAIECQFDEIAEMLIVSAKDQSGVENTDDRNALRGAACTRTRFLGSAGVNLNAVDESGQTALHCAVLGGRCEVTKLLLSNETVDVNVEDDDCMETPLHAAARRQHVGIAELLVANPKVNHNGKNGVGMTALHLSASGGRPGVARVLISSEKVDVNAKDDNGLSALDHAAMSGVGELVDMLISDPRVDVAAAFNQLEFPQHSDLLQLAAFESPNHRSRELAVAVKKHKLTPLHSAMLRGHRDVVAQLLMSVSQKLSMNVEDLYQQIPLHLALLLELAEVVEFHVRRGGSRLREDINMTDERRRTAFHVAVVVGRADFLKLLLSSYGPDEDAVKKAHLATEGEYGRTALDMARRGNRSEIVALLENELAAGGQ
jgi:ankyrin repeat protein